jgi:hypothetical protein
LSWHRVSDYVLEADGHTIAKTFHTGVPLYSLWRGKDMLGTYTSAKAAMEAVKGGDPVEQERQG